VFRHANPIAWAFHRNTSYTGLSPAESVEPYHQQAQKEYPHAPLVALPAPELPAATLAQVLHDRASCRRFADATLGPAQLGTLLWAAYGVRGRIVVAGLEALDRPVPSAGGLYPLELYVLVRSVERLEAGVYHYAALPHALEQVRARPLPRPLLAAAYLGQPYAGDASAVVVLTAVVERALAKYGDRGYRYLLLEAGHAAQNLELAAAALSLGACDLGGFVDHDVTELLDLDGDEEIPLSSVAVGLPAGKGRAFLRGVSP
jgi:SagB-type dehydrogenase family enzyme